MPPTDVAADVPVMCNVVQHLPSQLDFQFDVAQRIDISRPCRMWRWLRSSDARRYEVWVGARKPSEWRGGCRRTHEGLQGNDLVLVELLHEHLGMNLEPGADAGRNVRSDAVELLQRVLQEQENISGHQKTHV